MMPPQRRGPKARRVGNYRRAGMPLPVIAVYFWIPGCNQKDTTTAFVSSYAVNRWPAEHPQWENANNTIGMICRMRKRHRQSGETADEKHWGKMSSRSCQGAWLRHQLGKLPSLMRIFSTHPSINVPLTFLTTIP